MSLRCQNKIVYEISYEKQALVREFLSGAQHTGDFFLFLIFCNNYGGKGRGRVDRAVEISENMCADVTKGPSVGIFISKKIYFYKVVQNFLKKMFYVNLLLFKK